MAGLCNVAWRSPGPVVNAPPQCLRRGDGLARHGLQSERATAPLAGRTRRTRGFSGAVHVVCARQLRPVVERFKIHHEKNVSGERMDELAVSRWSKWECGPGISIIRRWKVDELVYIAKGSVEVIPEDCSDSAYFYAGDLVRFPKWFTATLTFEEDYVQCYKFLAYGD